MLLPSCQRIQVTVKCFAALFAHLLFVKVSIGSQETLCLVVDEHCGLNTLYILSKDKCTRHMYGAADIATATSQAPYVKKQET